MIQKAWLYFAVFVPSIDLAQEVGQISQIPAPEERHPQYLDFSIGPYPSSLQILLRSIRNQAKALDARVKYVDAAGQGYLLISIGRLLQAAAKNPLFADDSEKDSLVRIAIDEASELEQASHKVKSGAPGFGLDSDRYWFDGTQCTPAFTAYAWQSGLVALGLAEVVKYLQTNRARHPNTAQKLQRMTTFLRKMLDVWNSHYTSVDFQGHRIGWFWYSVMPHDSWPVNNTSALLAMASQIYSEMTGDPSYSSRAQEAARFFHSRLELTSAGGYKWCYAHRYATFHSITPFPCFSNPGYEDVSHASFTLQFIRFCGERGWFAEVDMRRTEVTILDQMWSGNPMRLHGSVDGSAADDTKEWDRTTSAVVGIAAFGNVLGGRAELFDYSRSIILSSYLTPFQKPLAETTVYATQCLALSQLFFDHPSNVYTPDSKWSVVAGENNDTAVRIRDTYAPFGVIRREALGGVRFYTIEWNQPMIVAAGGLNLMARSTDVNHANILIDLPESLRQKRVVVSLTFLSCSNGQVSQWDGGKYRPICPLPITKTLTDAVNATSDLPIWMRTSFVLDRSAYFDYENQTPGVNILLDFSNPLTLHKVEATPLD